MILAENEVAKEQETNWVECRRKFSRGVQIAQYDQNIDQENSNTQIVTTAGLRSLSIVVVWPKLFVVFNQFYKFESLKKFKI